MSNPQVIHRANDSSSLYQNIKSRKSLQQPFDYQNEGEVNVCPVARSRIVVSPTTSLSATSAQTLRFALPQAGLIEDIALQLTFTSAAETNDDTGAHDCALVEFAGAFAWEKCRLVYQGSTIWETTPYAAMCGLYSRANKEKASALDLCLGSGILGTSNDTLGSVTGRKAAASSFGGIQLSCPLTPFFSETLGRFLDGYSLSSQMWCEIDLRASSANHFINEGSTTGCSYSDAQLIAWVAELSPQELSAYQSRQYSPNSVSSQLAYTTSHFSESVATPVIKSALGGVGNVVKIQALSGLCRKLYIFATLDSDVASASAKEYFKLVDLASVKLSAGNQEIYGMANTCLFDQKHISVGTGYKTDHILENIHNNLNMASGDTITGISTTFDPYTNEIINPIGNGTTDMSRVKIIQFAYDSQDYSSADGCLALGQTNNPVVEVTFNTGHSGATTIHIVAEMITLATYTTNANGAVNFKVIQE